MFFMALTPARAAGNMIFPLSCQAGQTCWIIGYPDLNGNEGPALDYMCGPAAGDGDVFFRLGLGDLGMIAVGIRALAADSGEVVDVSEGVPDIAAASKADVKTGTPACGNGVVIDHGDGVRTVYCHLKKGSVRVKKGDTVRRGQTIGMVGQSGIAFWPQLGFSIQKRGFFIDPLTGATELEGCGLKPRPEIALQKEFLSYQPVAIVSLGFSNQSVEAEKMIRGDVVRFAGLDPAEKTMTLWAMILGIKKGDEIEIRMRDPRGRTFYYTSIIADQDSDRTPLNVPRTRGYSNWRTGLYTGEITVTRKIGVTPHSVSRSVTLDVN